MRTIVDLPDAHVEALDALRRREGISRAEVVRRAVAEHLTRHQADAAPAFGLWRARRVDGVAYQRRLRREWDHPRGGSRR
jgi:Arc/MetJ-type ribon-helix-helix transcriptional regulator